MRIIIILAIVFPCILHAQINRSATELARENIESYLENKLFKHMPYKPVSYGELTASTDPNREILWSIEHIFEITEAKRSIDKKTAILRQYKFVFYLDRKMNVLRAVKYSS